MTRVNIKRRFKPMVAFCEGKPHASLQRFQFLMSAKN